MLLQCCWVDTQNLGSQKLVYGLNSPSHNEVILSNTAGGTLTNLLEFFGEFNSRTDGKEAVDVVCLVFQKAFDNVPNVGLLGKMRAHDIKGEK